MRLIKMNPIVRYFELLTDHRLFVIELKKYINSLTSLIKNQNFQRIIKFI